MATQTVVRSSVAPNRLEGKVAIITGGDQSIGRAIALRLAAEGAGVSSQGEDVLMFQQSGLSIAMGNASPEVQRQAEFVTAPNEEEGFARAMEVFVLGDLGEFAETAS